MGDVMVRGCLGHSDHKIIAVFCSWRSKEGESAEQLPLDFQRAEFGNLADRIP